MTAETINLTDELRAREGTAVCVYTKDDCRQCVMTKRVLDKAGIYYTTVNAEHDPAALKYVTETLGYRQMPVVVASTIEGDEVWSGFQPLKIREHITDRPDAA